MSEIPKTLNDIINMYPFVRAEKERSDPEFISKRLNEYQLMKKQRGAVSFCKNMIGMRTINISSITNEEKELIEKCLYKNFLEKEPDYFGKRDTIFLDLFE